MLIESNVAVDQRSRSEVRPLRTCAEVEVILAETFVEDREAAPQGRLSIAKNVVSKTDARLREVLGWRESRVRAGAGVADQPQRFQHRHRVAHKKTISEVDGGLVARVVLARIHAVQRPRAFSARCPAAYDGVGRSHVYEAQAIFQCQAFGYLPAILGVGIGFPKTEPRIDGRTRLRIARVVTQHQVGQPVTGIERVRGVGTKIDAAFHRPSAGLGLVVPIVIESELNCMGALHQ